jgi:hypothetical protein
LEFSSFENPPGGGAELGTSLPASPPAPVYADRSTGLLIFGILEIIGGALALFAIPLMLLGLVLGRKAGGATPASSFVTLPLTYGALAAVLLTLGIGATQAKRWAWALNLILSWIWLIVGTLTTAMLVWVLPGAMLSGMREAAARSSNPAAPTTGVMAVILTLMIVFMAIFLIVLPLVFLLFYRSRNVELTCKYRDPVERWTDRRPLPIVGYAIVAAFGAAYYLVLAFTTPLTPFFGRYLTGIPAAAVFIVFALVDGFVSVSFFRMKVVGWWVAIVALSIRLLAALLTIGRGNLLEAYARIGWSQRQLEVLNKNPMFHGGGMLWMMVAFTAVYLGFLIWVRRYFRPTVPPAYTETATAISSSTPTGF